MAIKVNKEQIKQEENGEILAPKGEYKFKILSSEEKTSDKTSDGKIFSLKLLLIAEDGTRYQQNAAVGQWLFGGGATHFLGFLDSIGLDPEGDIDAKTCINKTGRLVLKPGKEFKGKAQMAVDYFIPSVEELDLAEVDDEDVPF